MIFYLVRPKQKVVLFPEIDRMKKILSLTHLHSRMCIKICIFKFKKHQTNKQKTRIQKKPKKTNEEKRISPENRLKKINLRPAG